MDGDNRKTRCKTHLFLKLTLLIIGFCAFVMTIALTISAFISPPEIPEMPIASSNENTNWIGNEDNSTNNSELAFLPPEDHEEDLLIGSGLTAPEGFTSDDRKEMFYTFLILGLDEGINVDTIIVASYNGIRKEANFISIPRDSLVNVRRNVRKLNAAYPAGTLRGGGIPGGIAQMQREVMTIIGFVPDFYILIDFDAFVKIIDAVGGIEINVPFDMSYDDPHQDLQIDIKEGLQLLDGSDALNFVRYRRGNRGYRSITDYQRMEHQQAVISATLSNLLKPASIPKIPELIEVISENVHTNLTLGNILWFASQLNEVRGTEALSTYTIPTSGTSGRPMWYEILDARAIVDLVNQTINPYEKDIELRDLNIISS